MLLACLSQKFLNHLELQDVAPNETVSAAAGIINDVVQNDQTRVSHLVTWCCSTSGAGLGHSIGIRRAVVALLAKDKETITLILEKSVNQFGDQLYIKHTAIMQQQGERAALFSRVLWQTNELTQNCNPQSIPKSCFSLPDTSPDYLL